MRSDTLKRHMKRHGIVSTYQEKHKCIYCNYTSDIAFSVRRHIGRKHEVEGKDVLARHKHMKKHLNPVPTKDLSTRPSEIVANPSHITPPPPPPSPVAQPELINHMLEKHENGDDNAENYTTELNVINRGYIIGKHKKVNCRICLKTMGSNNLKKHMRQHEKKQARMTQKGVIGKEEYHSTLDVAAIGNLIDKDTNEFRRILELGRVIK